MKIKLFLIPLLTVSVLVTALAVVVVRHDARKQYKILQQMRAQRDAYEVEWGQLQLEMSSQATHGRIAEKAAKKLQMGIPDSSETVIVVR